MKNEVKLLLLRKMHQALLDRITKLNPKDLPKGVDAAKLERAYESLKGYEFVLKKIR